MLVTVAFYSFKFSYCDSITEHSVKAKMQRYWELRIDDLLH